MTDDGFYLVLNTFPNLKSIEIVGSKISLTTAADIPQKLGALTQLKRFQLNHTNVFSVANSANIDFIYEWLAIFLQFYQKVWKE